MTSPKNASSRTTPTRLSACAIADGRALELDLDHLDELFLDSRPLVGDSKLWLEALGKVHAMANQSRALDVPGVSEHRIELVGLARGGPLVEWKEQILKTAAPKLYAFSAATADLAMRARKASDPGSRSEKLFSGATRMFRKLAHDLYLIGGSPHVERLVRPAQDAAKEQWLYPSANKVILLDRSNTVGPFAFDSKLDYCCWVIAHEIGHVVQFARGRESARLFHGIDGAEPARATALEALGLLDTDAVMASNKSFENAAVMVIAENYADLTAVLVLSGNDRYAIVKNIDILAANRADGFPPEVSGYDSDRANVYHDTREALAELRARVASGAPIPQTSDDIAALVFDCAQTGLLRWASSLLRADAGAISHLARARLARSMPEASPQQAAATLEASSGGRAQIPLGGKPLPSSHVELDGWRNRKPATPKVENNAPALR